MDLPRKAAKAATTVSARMIQTQPRIRKRGRRADSAFRAAAGRIWMPLLHHDRDRRTRAMLTNPLGRHGRGRFSPQGETRHDPLHAGFAGCQVRSRVAGVEVWGHMETKRRIMGKNG